MFSSQLLRLSYGAFTRFYMISRIILSAFLIYLMVVLSIANAHESLKLPSSVAKTEHLVVKLSVWKRANNEAQSDRITPKVQNQLDQLKSHINQSSSGKASNSGEKAVGTGFILNNDGFVISNAHLLKDAYKIEVEFSDGKKARAKIIGININKDIGLIQVRLKQSIGGIEQRLVSKIRVGESVYAIGAPFGFAGSVTTGIVSAIRVKVKVFQNKSFIQTDIAINPGNSGGPLFTYDGKLIGIISQIMSTNGGSQGVSFAIPIVDVMKAVTKILQKKGKQSK